MKKIPISASAKYAGQTMKWTETMKSTRITGTFFHYSNKKINKFLTKETCFWKEDAPNGKGHAYMITINDDRNGQESTNDEEYRFVLKETDEIFYLGSFAFFPTETVETVYSRERGGMVTRPVLECRKVN